MSTDQEIRAARERVRLVNVAGEQSFSDGILRIRSVYKDHAPTETTAYCQDCCLLAKAHVAATQPDDETIANEEFIASLPNASQDGKEGIYCIQDVVFDCMWSNGNMIIKFERPRDFTRGQIRQLLTALQIK